MQRTFVNILILWFLFLGTNAQVIIADFESPETTPAIIADGGVYGVVDNPDPSGINTSPKVGYYHKLDTNWQYVSMLFPDTFQIGNNNTLTFKLHSSTQGRIFAKFWIGDDILIENWAPDWNFKPTANKWVECTADISPAMKKGFTVLQLAASVDNLAEAEVYFDDVVLSNPNAAAGNPVAVFSASKTLIHVGDSILFDASGSYDPDSFIVAYDWNFSDGTTDTGVFVWHTYTTDSVFKAQLVVTDNEGKTGVAYNYIYVLQTGEVVSKLHFVESETLTNEKVEGIFKIEKDYTNVYNPEEVKIDAEILLPDNDTMLIPCFYYIKALHTPSDWMVDTSIQNWVVRFSSPQAGLHSVKLIIDDIDGLFESNPCQINIGAGTTKGIIRNDTANNQFYRHSTGEPFFPLGINAGWASTTNYTTIINNLSAGNANVFRYWHTPFAKQALEWKVTNFYNGLGNYSQEAAAMTDSLIDLCEQTDMHMQLAIFQHGMFSENVDPMWEDNPYNTINGGFVPRAEQYFYNDSCKKYAKKLLRYIIARWGYSPNIFAWEFFNEVQFTGINNSQTSQWYPGVLAWHSEMGKYMESIDPFDHILTTSAANNQLYDLDTVDALDVVQYHLYVANLLEGQRSLDEEFKANLQECAIINGEYGTDVNAETPFDMQRKAIWNSIMTHVPHFMWLWDYYLESTWADLFYLPGKYLQGEDLVSDSSLMPLTFTASSLKADLVNLGFRSDSAYYGFLYNEANISGIDDASISIQAIPYANYKIDFYLSESGQIIARDSVPLITLEKKIKLPTFSKDMAFKINYLSAYTLPIAIAGYDTVLIPGQPVVLSGVLSENPAGLSLEYTWNIIEKPETSTLTIADPNQMNITVTPEVAGIYKFTLVVNDVSNTSVPDTMMIIASRSPIANAGRDSVVVAARYTTLDGSGSYDPDGDMITYLWTCVSSPVGSDCSISAFADTDPVAFLRLDEYGVYLIKLVVNDGVSDSEPDTVRILSSATGVFAMEGNLQPGLYPNPVVNNLYIDLDEAVDLPATIYLYNALGTTILTDKIELIRGKAEINLAEKQIAPGIYLIRIFADDKVYAGRILFTGE
ncbi:MAG: PKD domain-containing protein [Bacteroidales bacterium]|nr:PKD domain-containing protein [Bacteroidales bacterium]